MKTHLFHFTLFIILPIFIYPQKYLPGDNLYSKQLVSGILLFSKKIKGKITEKNRLLRGNIMRIIFLFMALILIFNSCQNPTETDNSLNKVYLATDKTSYSKSDNISVLVNNKSNSEIQVTLRCRTFLEMFYQMKLDSVWSDNLMFQYMNSRCLNSLDTIKQDDIFNYALQSEKSEIVDSTGTYRFVLKYYPLPESVAETTYSNPFEVK